MFATVVYIHVKREHVADFIEAVRVNHDCSVREPGNLRFDVLQSVDDPTRFVTYMAYTDESSALAHRDTAHYLVFRDTVADWMVEPRRNISYEGILPAIR